jgi:hypothetical protein
VLSIGTLLAGCGADPDEAAPDPSASSLTDRPTLDQLTMALSCDEVEPVELTADRYGFGDTGDCLRDDELVGRVHVVPPESEPGVRRRFSERFTSSDGLNPCDDGSAARVPWVILGRGWAVVTPTRQGANHVAGLLGGEVLTDFTGDGPPVSYGYPKRGLCPGDAAAPSNGP